MSKTKAPWTDEQCAKLNKFQRCGYMHPFTCGGERGDEHHRRVAEVRSDGDRGLLIATPDGWICPACDYRQNWAHEFMLNGAPPDPFAAFQAPPPPGPQTEGEG